jgi:hypothetical protein
MPVKTAKKARFAVFYPPGLVALNSPEIDTGEVEYSGPPIYDPAELGAFEGDGS